MKKSLFIKFSPIYAALISTATILGPVAAQTQEVTCAPNGCNYSYGLGATTDNYHWSDHITGNRIEGSTPLHLIVEAGHYQNTPKTENGNRDGGIVTTDSLIGLSRFTNNTDTAPGTLHIKSGVTATLREDYASSSAVEVNNAKAVLEKGVSIIIEDNYSQIHNDPNYHGDDGDTAIEARDRAEVRTQADIVLNNRGSEAFYNDSAEIYSENHNITMNGEGNIAYVVVNSGKTAINKVNITGNGEYSTLFDIYTEQSDTPSLTMSHSTVRLNGKNSYISTYGQEELPYSSNTHLTDSNIHSDKGFLIWTDAEESNDRITLDNSTIQTKSALISVNDAHLLPMWEEDGEKLSTTSHNRFEVVANQSVLQGAAIVNHNTESSKNVTTALTLNNSQWQFDQSSTLTRLTLNEAKVSFQPTSNAFNTLTLQDLSGTGTFDMNTDLASQQADKIIVQGMDSGSFGLNIHDSGNEPNASNGKVTLVETQTGMANFQLTGRDYVDAGAYRYRLNKEGNNWVLSNQQPSTPADPVTPPTDPITSVVPVSPSNPSTDQANNQNPTTPTTPTTPVVPVSPSNPSTDQANNQNPTTPTTPTTPVVPVSPSNPSTDSANNQNPAVPPTTVLTTPTQQVMLSEKSNALVSLRQAQLALLDSGLEGLHQRLGELKKGEKGNVWVRNVNSRNEFDATRTAHNSQSSGFKQDIHQLQFGADIALSDNFRLGGFVGNARSDVDFMGEYGSGKVKAQSIGLYGTYLANNGFYWDNIAKYDHLTSESSSTGKRKYNAYTLSSEIGRIHPLGQGWTVTPQLQGAWTTISSHADEERLSAFTARAGVRVAKAIELKDWALQPYAEVNGITTHTNSNKVRVNQYLFDVAESKGRLQTALGVNASWGNHRLGVEGSSSYGKHLDQPYKVQAAYRYHW